MVTITDSIFACEGESVQFALAATGLFPITTTIVSSLGRELALDLDVGTETVSVQVLPGIEIWSIDRCIWLVWR